MGKYSGINFGTACMHEKEEIKHALNGEVLAGWDENGKHWEKAEKAETDAVILRAYDELYYQAEQLRSSGCAMEKIHGNYTPDEFQKYIQYVEEERQKHSNDYEFEHQE